MLSQIFLSRRSRLRCSCFFQILQDRIWRRRSGGGCARHRNFSGFTSTVNHQLSGSNRKLQQQDERRRLFKALESTADLTNILSSLFCVLPCSKVQKLEEERRRLRKALECSMPRDLSHSLDALVRICRDHNIQCATGRSLLH